MRLAWLILLGLQLVVSHNLPEYTNDDFDVRIKEKKFTLVMFYAPWCGHCKRLKPDFITAGEKLADNPNVGFALVDCTTQDKICSRFEVSGYPTLKFFKDGEFHAEYDGSRDEAGLMNFALSRSQPPSREITSKNQLNELLESDVAKHEPIVVSFIKSGDSKLSEIHEKVAADLLGKAKVAHTSDANVFGETGGKSFIRLYRPKSLITKLTEPHIDYDGKLDTSSVLSWITSLAHGLVGYRSLETVKFFPRDDIFLFYHNDSLEKYPKGVNYHRNRLIKAIKDSGIRLSKLTFLYSYSEDFSHEVSELQPESKDLPLVVIKSGGKRYKLDEYSREKLIDFLKSFEAGKLEPFIKSEPIPTEQSSSALKVVAHSFDELVNDPSKDVFIMFHAPWCGHCKQLMPKFEAVAEKLKNEPNVRMVTFDATANDVPHPYEVRGYPTLYFASKSSKHSPKRYEGQRGEEDLIKFIAKESTDELKGYDREGNEKKTDL